VAALSSPREVRQLVTKSRQHRRQPMAFIGGSPNPRTSKQPFTLG
jgi:hypothetical protein